MTVLLYGDVGRINSTMLLMVEDGVCKVCLIDRDTEQTLWKSGKSFLEALDGMEADLQSGACQWRAKKPYQPKRG